MNCAALSRICATVAYLLLLSPVGAFAQARLENSAKDATYPCPTPSPDAVAETATKLGMAQWDKNKLGCSADLWFALAQNASAKPMLQVQALLAATAYIDQVNKLASFDLYSVHQGEWEARIQHAANNGKIVEQRLGALPIDNANVLAARALYRLTWPIKIADAKTQMAESSAAFELLAKAVALDPKALDGNALWLLGRLYYDLPEFAGGDPAKGMALLEDAYRNTPQNVSLLRYSAYVFVQERQLPQAKQRLAEMLKLRPDPANLQLLADELKSASELANRAGDATLAQRLAAKRHRASSTHTHNYSAA